MMHPSRQAYVEEDDPEVSNHPVTAICFRNVHTCISESNQSHTGDTRVGKSKRRRLIGCLETLGYGDGGGSSKYT